ncbi:hypothetical protein KCP69_25895 [Salmonella enterica subsp. enterica]|nr:hypothetical protein KCP69_25895 [Salmonella enterica subsp. enterica]
MLRPLRRAWYRLTVVGWEERGRWDGGGRQRFRRPRLRSFGIRYSAYNITPL